MKYVYFVSADIVGYGYRNDEWENDGPITRIEDVYEIERVLGECVGVPKGAVTLLNYILMRTEPPANEIV